MPSQVSVGILGNAASAVAATEEVSTAFAAMGADITATAADTATAMAETSAAMTDLAATADAASGDVSASFAAMSADVDASMADAAAGMADTSAAMTDMAATADTTGASMLSFSSIMGSLGELTSVDAMVGSLTSSIQGLGSSVMTMIGTAAMFVTVMAGWQMLQDVAGWVENLIQQMFQLDETTQRTVQSWKYLFAEQPGGGQKAAQGLASWAYQESPNLPFTAMDLRGGLSTLAAIGMSPGQLEQFMPILADIASTYGASDYGGQGITLQQAANVIQMAHFGLSRMLRTELHINPQDLLKFGLKGTATATGLRITDPNTLIPAIEGWAQAHGLQGAAQAQETQTFWGAYSSFQDYTQNLLQTIGGINPATGGVVQGSMFGDLMRLLINVNSFLGAGQTGESKNNLFNQAQTAAGNIMGGATGGILGLGTGVLAGVGAGTGAGFGTDLFDKIKDFGQWLMSSGVQKHIQEFGEAIGQWLGSNLKSAQEAMPDLSNALQIMAHSIVQLEASISPQERAVFGSLLGDVLETAAALITFGAHFLNLVSTLNSGLERIQSMFTSWAVDLKNNFFSWGADFIIQLTGGITSAIPGLLRTIQNDVGGMIRKNLHFSKPEEGPLADADKWMPDMMALLEEGILRGLPMVARASQQAAAAIAAPLGGGIGAGGAGNSYATNYATTTNYGNSSANIAIYASQELAIRNLIDSVMAGDDQQGYLRWAAPGGFSLFGVH